MNAFSEFSSQMRWIQNPVLSGVWVRFPPEVQKSLDENLGFF